VTRIIAGGITFLMISACATAANERRDISPRAAAAGTTCPVTIPPRPGLVPPDPYPPEPPSSFDAVWYGTPELWTALDRNGQVWRGLAAEDGSVGDKTLWWSENYSIAAGEDFGRADIFVKAEQLDGSARTVVVGGGVGSFNPDIGNFMLVGLVLPKQGCWKVTASYRDADLAYVIRVAE
jgi:hypothetical protein